MAMIKWIITNSTSFTGLAEKDNNALYFLQDTQEIYKGSTSFTQSVMMVSSFPEKGAQGKVYMHSTTLEGKVWTGSEWKTIIEQVAKSLADGVTENKAVSGEAVKTYVTQKVTEAVANKFVEGITYSKDTKELSYTIGDRETKVGIEGFVTNAQYEGTTGKLTFSVQGGEAIEINLPKDNFVQSGRYDDNTQEIILTLVDGSEVKIPAGDLVDVYTFSSTNTIEMTETDGAVTAKVKVSAESGNQLEAKGDGLYVAATDISGKLDKVAGERADEIITAKADGTVKVSGIKAGNATLAEDANANTLATEAAVAAIRATLEGSISTKVAKSDITTSISAVGSASDTKVASEKAVAQAIEKLNGDKVDKTDVIAEVSVDSNSATKVASEAAVIAAISWVTLN